MRKNISYNKRGYIKISGEMLRNGQQAVFELFSKFLPGKIEYDLFVPDTLVYFGICEDFEELPDGAAPLEYEVMFQLGRDERGEIADCLKEIRKVDHVKYFPHQVSM